MQIRFSIRFPLICCRSWENTFNALSQYRVAPTEQRLESHLSDPEAVRILTHPFFPFPAPTPQTKASFETKTSAINVTPSPQARYDIKQIQNDSLWLSKETNIDEVAALRIVVLEWQSRSGLKLLLGNPDEDAATVKDGSGGFSPQALTGASQSLAFARSSLLDKAPSESLDQPDVRRQRLLELYLSELEYVLKTSEYTIFTALCETTSSAGKGESGWLGKLGHGILTQWDISGHAAGSKENVLVTAVKALGSRVQALENGSGWLKDEGPQEQLETAFSRNKVLEMIHIMRIMLVLLESSPKISRSDAILAWFRFMASFGFFESFEPVN